MALRDLGKPCNTQLAKSWLLVGEKWSQFINFFGPDSLQLVAL